MVFPQAAVHSQTLLLHDQSLGVHRVELVCAKRIWNNLHRMDYSFTVHSPLQDPLRPLPTRTVGQTHEMVSNSFDKLLSLN